MTARGTLGVLLTWTLLLSAAAQAQVAAPSYEVARGDTLFGVARKTRYEGVTRNQMIWAIWGANPDAFPGGNANLLEVGTILIIPSAEIVARVEPAEADRQVRELLARLVAPGPAVATISPPAPMVVPAPRPPEGGVLGKDEAARRYREGLVLERKGDHEGAFKAFLEAGEAGYGLAQRRLGEIYDVGSPAVKRDYQVSLKWYQKAREQGVEIAKPIQRGPVH